MSNHGRQNDHNMVDTLTTILNKVRFFGYGGPDVDTTAIDPTLNTVLEQACNLHTTRMTQGELPENVNKISGVMACPKPIALQRVQYTDMSCNSLTSSSGYSEASGYSTNTIPESLSSSSYTGNTPLAESYCSSQYQDDFSDKEDEDYDIDNRTRDSRTETEEQASPALPEYSLNDVAQHDIMHDCWIVLYDKVYDVTSFLYEHPGGEDLIMEHAGRDGTIAFRGVGHSKAAVRSLHQYLIGELPVNERIFTYMLEIE